MYGENPYPQLEKGDLHMILHILNSLAALGCFGCMLTEIKDGNKGWAFINGALCILNILCLFI